MKQEWLLAFQSKIQTQKGLKRMLFVRTKRIMKIVQVISFFKLQNNT